MMHESFAVIACTSPHGLTINTIMRAATYKLPLCRALLSVR